MASVWVGTSGYVLRHCHGGVFYPAGLRLQDRSRRAMKRWGGEESHGRATPSVGSGPRAGEVRQDVYVYNNNDREAHAV
jgi:hypothetical protein